MSRKQELKQPDQVQVAIETALETANEKRGPILIIIGVLILASAVVMAWRHNQELTLEKYNLELVSAARLIEEARFLEDEALQAEKRSEAREVLQMLNDETLGGELHPFVLASWSDLLIDEGQYREAIGILQELVSVPGLDPIMRNAAYYKLMKTFVADYNLPEAMAISKEALEATDGPFTPLIEAEQRRLQTGSLNPALSEELKAEIIGRRQLKAEEAGDLPVQE